MRAAAILPLLLLLGACWGPRYFAPREHAAATGPDGDLAALYAVAGVPGQPGPAGEVRIWSNGARALFTEDDREIVELYVGFEIENNSDQPLQLDLASVTCEELAVGGVRQGPLTPQRYTGDGLAPPKTTSRVDLVFEPAGAEAPYQIDGFSVRFVVRAGAGESSREALVQVTPFGPFDPNPYPYDPYWGWGWGVGFSWSHHHHCH